MKTYLISSDTNYGHIAQVVNTGSKEEAKKIALENGAWEDCEVKEIDVKTKGMVYNSFD